jgi:hypothetical protein
MQFFGYYDLPDYTHKGWLPQDLQIVNQHDHPSLWACTCFSARNEHGSQLLGRNFDWENHPALLLFTDPPGRYASVSMVDISYLGYSKSENPGKDPGIECWNSFVQKILDSMPLVDRNRCQAILC